MLELITVKTSASGLLAGLPLVGLAFGCASVNRGRTLRHGAGISDTAFL